MAWVRSFRKNSPRRRRRYRRNPYPMAGTVAALNPHRRRRHRMNPHRRRRHYRRNPVGLGAIARGGLGLPPLMPVVYGAGGFIGTAMVQGFVDTLVPATWKSGSSTQSLGVKYAEIAASIVIVTYAAKTFLNRGAAAMAAVGGGIFAIQQAAHDFAGGLIPGMHAYTPLRSYTPVRNTLGRSVSSAGGAWPSLAKRRLSLAAPDYGAMNSTAFAGDGGMNVVNARFRRFA